MKSGAITIAHRELGEAEAKVAFVRTVDERRCDGLTGPQIWRAAYVAGYLRALAPRSMAAIEMDMTAMVETDGGITTPGWRGTQCVQPTI